MFLHMDATSCLCAMPWTLPTQLSSTCPLRSIQAFSLPSVIHCTPPTPQSSFLLWSWPISDPLDPYLSPVWDRGLSYSPLGPMAPGTSQNVFVWWLKAESLQMGPSPVWALSFTGLWLWPLIPSPTSNLFPPSIVLARLASIFLDSQSLNLWPFSVSPGNHSLFQKASHIPNKKINLLHLLKIKQSYNSLNRRLRTAITKSGWCQSLSHLGDYSPGKWYECLRIPSLYFLDFLCIFLKRSRIQIIFFSSVINTVSSTWSK